MTPNATSELSLVREIYGGEIYEYYPLGKYVVMAPGVCGGRPTFKGTRLEAKVAVSRIAAGWTAEEFVERYFSSDICVEAVEEAVRLAQAEALSA